MCESVNRIQLANELHCRGYSCAQAVACTFADVVGLPVERLAALCGAFGGGFRAEEICGVVSGAAVVIGAKWPHSSPEDQQAKDLAAAKMKEFHSRFFSRFPSLVCRDLKPLDPAPEKSPAAMAMGIEKTCGVYIVSAVEILEEMLAEG